MFTHDAESVGLHIVCNFNTVMVEGLPKVTASYVHCKSDMISEAVQDGDVIILIGSDNVAYKV